MLISNKIYSDEQSLLISSKSKLIQSIFLSLFCTYTVSNRSQTIKIVPHHLQTFAIVHFLYAKILNANNDDRF